MVHVGRDLWMNNARLKTKFISIYSILLNNVKAFMLHYRPEKSFVDL